MATKKITFDPSAGVPVASNLTIYTGADFNATFDVYNVSNSAYILANGCFTTAWSGSGQIQKSAGVAATTTPSATFTVDRLPGFRYYRIKLLMTSNSQVYVPRIKALRVLALA